MSTTRSFRTDASYKEEAITRNMLKGFLEERGFTEVVDQREKFGRDQSQTLLTVAPNGRKVCMRVKLAWRKGNEREGRGYSAAQLMARINGGKWSESVQRYVDSMLQKKQTHLLIVQREDDSIAYAAQIEADQLLSVWEGQRAESARLLKNGAMGRRHKNHAENGGSPTIWLEDARAPTVADVMWTNSGVVDLALLPAIDADKRTPDDDTDADLSGVDVRLLGRDAAARVLKEVSGVPRNPAVRKAVLNRCKGKCERPGCGAGRDYAGFLDVHHILGAERSDRPWTCVALCPNCHREAHFSPDRDRLNRELLDFAARFHPGVG